MLIATLTNATEPFFANQDIDDDDDPLPTAPPSTYKIPPTTDPGKTLLVTSVSEHVCTYHSQCMSMSHVSHVIRDMSHDMHFTCHMTCTLHVT